ncbi:uncharacterized protein [Tursiops truncatus]|uniref:Translation initiation factor IF-2-like n=1 Tax=Tursiops truncatus TaxID=9739 RepID=A0A6J3RKL1_TURTR|nr:translation initiation factor IF-2-like [Tursiops truncatus]
MLASIGVLEDVTDLTGLHPNQNLGRPDPCPARVQESLPTSTRTSQTVQEASGAAGCCLLCSGPDAAYGPGNATSGARELQSGAARVDKPGGGGGGEDEAEHTLAHAAPRSPRLGGEDRSFGGRRVGTPSPPHGLLSGRRGAHRRPRARRGLTRPTLQRPSPAPRARRRPHPQPGESPARKPRAPGHCGRPGLPGGLLVAGQLSGSEGGVRTRKRRAGAAGEGRGRSAEAPASSGQAEKLQTHWRQWRWQRRRSCSSLRVFLGHVQDGGAPCTGFPVTLAMGRTTKEGGRRMRTQLEKPGRVWPWPGLLTTPLPQSSPLDSSQRCRTRPSGPRARRGGGKRLCASAVARPRLLWEVTAQVSVGPAETPKSIVDPRHCACCT